MKQLKYITILVLGLLITLTSCSSSKELNAAKNNDDPEKGPKMRLELANKYYDEGDFYKAIQLYEIVIQENIMKEDLAEVYFRYAFSHYAQYDYVTASTLFNNFYQSYPDNKNAETAYFYRAMSNYELAEDDFRLDQSTMTTAMKEFQDYLISFPEGEYVTKAQNLINEIKTTRERKELEIGKLYYKIEEYKAAISEFNRFIENNPNSGLVEEAYYEIIKARYELAKHSVESKKKERYDQVIKDYSYFMDKYSDGPYHNSVKEIKNEAEKELKRL